MSTEDQIREQLLDYAWLGTPDEQRREVDCIMAQDGWKYLSARSEHLMAQRSGENSVEDDRALADGLALSGLYECHDVPHLPTCPRWREGQPTPEAWKRSGEDASLGVGHVWTNVRCPAYRSLEPSDCNCGKEQK